MSYTVQMLYRDALGSFWDDVSPVYATRDVAFRALETREAWCLDADDFDSELRVYCHRAPRAPRVPQPAPVRRTIAPPARVYTPELRKASRCA